MTILVTGANGQLGNELRALLCHSRENGNLIKNGLMKNDKTDDDNFLFVAREELDITDQRAVEYFFSIHKIDYCINAAAYTDVEKAEDEHDAAYAVNVLGAKNIAKTCAKNNAILFHISTDFVFDGKKTVPYTENDKPHPLGVYATTKYKAETEVQESCSRTFIIRTSWLYSSFGKNFVKTILRLCRERDSLPVVADQYGSPTYARDLAATLLQMIGWCELRNRASTNSLEQGQTQGTVEMGSGTNSRVREIEPDPSAKLSQTSIMSDLTVAATLNKQIIPFGIYHYANEGEVTWFEFAQKICAFAHLSCDIKPIPASEYQSRTIRPAYSALSTKKIQAMFGIVIPEWDESLKQCLALLLTFDNCVNK